MHLYYFVDNGSVGSVLFDVALMPVYFDLFRLLTLAFVRLPLRLIKFFNLCGVQLYEMGFRPFVGSVHLDPSWVRLLWGPSTLWIGVLTLGGVHPLYRLV